MKFNLIIVTMLKDESEYLDEWLCYYLNLGVEHFFIYNNNSTDALHDILCKYINAGLVTLIFWPKKYGQLDAFNHSKFFLEGKTAYIGFLDVDEFLVLKKHSSILDFLSEIDADQVLVPWKNFGYCGHQSRPNGLVIENYTYCVNNMGVQVKHFFKPDKVSAVGVHCSTPIDGTTIKYEDGALGAHTHMCDNPTYSNAQINHYQTKSFEEFSKRVQKGEGGSFISKSVPPFSSLDPKFNSNLIYDDSIDKYMPFLKQTINKFSQIANMPHRYGTRQVNKVLYSNNNIVMNFLINIGNFLSGLDQPCRTSQYQFFTVSNNDLKTLSPFSIPWALGKNLLKVYIMDEFDLTKFIVSDHFNVLDNFYSIDLVVRENFTYSGCIEMSCFLDKDINLENYNGLYVLTLNYEVYDKCLSTDLQQKVNSQNERILFLC